MKFAHFDVLSLHPGFCQSGLGGKGRHFEAYQVDAAAVEEGGRVRGETLTGDKDGAVLEVGAGGEEVLRYDYDCGAAVGGRAALEFCEGRVDGGGVEDLLEGVGLAELGVGVLLGV